jgi:hypothetical protein
MDRGVRLQVAGDRWRYHDRKGELMVLATAGIVEGGIHYRWIEQGSGDNGCWRGWVIIGSSL